MAILPKRREILVIDDDPDDRELLAQAIVELGYNNTVVFLENGEVALEYLKGIDHRPFLILCDVNMPRINGNQLRNMIVENPLLHEKSIPFVFFTTSTTQSSLEDAYHTDVQGFFLKESSFEELKETIHLIIRYWQKCELPDKFGKAVKNIEIED